MPYYRRRSRWPYRSWRRGVRSSQQQGTRRFSISIPVEGYGSCIIDANQHQSYSLGFGPFYNSNASAVVEPGYKYGTLVASNLFQTYCNLYDEVKLNSCSVQLAVTGLPENGQSVKVVSSVDRHANLDDIRHYRASGDISGAPETDSRMFTSLTNARVWRSFRARDSQERTVFVDSTLGTRTVGTDPNTYTAAGLIEFLDCSTLYGAFNPLVYFFFEISKAPAAQGSISFQYRVVWNLTFRNPKYGLSGSAKFGDMRAEAIEDVKEGESVVSEGSALRKKVKFEEPVYEESVIPDDESVGMDDESSQPELTKEELLEMLKKFEDKKS